MIRANFFLIILMLIYFSTASSQKLIFSEKGETGTKGPNWSLSGYSLWVSQATVKTVGASGADYTNLRLAFDAINSGALTGDIELQIVSSITDNNTAKLYGAGQVGEISVNSGGSGYAVGDILTFSPPQNPGTAATARVSVVTSGGIIASVELTNPGSGYTSVPTIASSTGSGTGASLNVLIGGDYTGVSIYPTVSGTVLSGSIQAAIINLLGADNITIDGRVNKTGTTRSLTIQNTNSLLGSAVISASNDVKDLDIKYLNIFGSRENRIQLVASTNGLGCERVNIESNLISTINRQNDTGRGIAITGNLTNKDIIVKNNEFRDLLATSYYGIRISDANDIIIEGNHFYETVSRSLTANNRFVLQVVKSTTVDILNNYIGGSAPLTVGDPWSHTSTGNNLIAIRIDQGSDISIQGNTIDNFNTTMGNGGSLTAIDVLASSTQVSIGNEIPNQIGSLSETPTVTCTNCSINGIYTSSESTIIENNTISGLSAGVNVYGIWRLSGSGNIVGNTISNLTTSGGSVIAIENRPLTGADVIKNYVYNLSSSASGNIIAGIVAYGGSISNNIIHIQASGFIRVSGISKTSPGTLNLYYNTIVIDGEVSSGSMSSHAIFDSRSDTRNYRNNIFVNNAISSGTATGKHYAIALTSSPATIDYNNYYASGTGGVLGVFNSVEKATLKEWKASTTLDCFSTSLSPGFPIPTGSLISNFLPTESSLVAQPVETFTTDYLNTTRSGSTPAMGALEYTVTPSDDVFSITSFTPTSGDAGTIVTITGVDFTGVTSVKFNGVNATSFTVVDTTAITATAPPNVSTGKISVSAACGTVSSTNDFLVLQVPSAPTNLLATPCGSQIVISFTAGYDGGSPITNYEYTLDGMSWIAFSPAVTGTTVTATILASGTYNISLRALNSAGSGVSSTTVTATIDTNVTIAYTGPTTATATNKSATITLSATVTLPAGADITQSQLRFINRDTGQDISGWLSLTGSSNTGTALFAPHALSMGTYEIFRKFKIGFEVMGAGCISRNSQADDVVITLAEPGCGCY